MTLHKLTAGTGYTYLTRQVAAHDATERGVTSLGDYYSEKGEAPGVWMGRGLAGVPDFPVGEQVSEAQMVALFGRGRHPNAAAIERAAQLAGMEPQQIDHASRLGAPYRVFEQANEFRRRCAEAFRDHNIDRGLDAVTPVPEEDRAWIRTTVASAMFIESYGRPPADARELSGHLARISRQATTAVAGYDLTFSPVKSVSTLWAIAQPELATVIEQAQADAVADTIAWLEEHATYTRTGRNGVAQVEVRGLIAAAFTHRDSRAGDPDLHTHVAISNKVQTAADGRWLALDGRPIYKNKVAASERYNTRLEALLVDRLGVRFADRPSAEPSKRPVREIVGIDGPLPRLWSSRRQAIDLRRSALARQFQADHGRPPTTVEAISLAQRANLETRQAKHEPRSHAEQRALWRAQALATLGGEERLRAYLDGVLRGTRGRPSRPTRAWVTEIAQQVVAVVGSERATWQENHVRAEAERRVRTTGLRLADIDRAVDAVVAAALSPRLSIRLDGGVTSGRGLADEPAALRRSDGTSVYEVAGSARYTSSEVLAAEQLILTAAGRRDGRVTPTAAIEVALLESVANGVTLNPSQVQLVRELATSGARVQLALAPAGTGKTTALQALATAWRAGGGEVIGLAPSAAAATVLREQIGADTDTLAKLIHALTTGIDVPPWLPSIGPGTLVVVDEAGMAGTPDLARLVAHVTAAGGSVRLVGDDQQLAAVGAGGVLRDLAATHGTVGLSQVVRFTDPDTGAPNHAEAAASLALRDGDPAALAYYADHGRVHVGDLATITDQAYNAWAADRAADRDALMLAHTRELVAELNARARADRLARQPGPIGREILLADSLSASVGDAVITRRNERTLALGATDWVKNGDRWTVTAVHDSGALDVVQQRTGRHVTLPVGYVTQHVTLGYATTVHGAQGVTADTCYALATGAENRQLLYVALTRGRHANHVFLLTAGDGDPHSLITRDALLPPTAVELLTRVLARDGSPTSAISQERAMADPAGRISASADQYFHALSTAAEHRLGPKALAAIDEAAEAAAAGVTGQDAYPVLRGHLALCAVAGQHPADALRRAVAWPRGLHDARDTAAVLDWRIDPTGHPSTGIGPLPWLPAVPESLRADPEWGPYLADRAEEVTALAAAVSLQANAWTPTSAPAWALPLLDRDPELVVDLAVWRTAHGVDDADRRPTGPALPAAADARAQRRLEARVVRLLGKPGTAAAQWTAVARSVDPRINGDPYWPTLAERLTAARRAGIDVTPLFRAAGDRPLPDEQPAAALWWRLAGRLFPAALTAGDLSAQTLRPDWTPILGGIVGDASADRMLADPGWPALVAAVGSAGSRGWQPEQVLLTAYELLCTGQPDNEPLRSDELTNAVAWRIGVLTDSTSGRRTDTSPPPADLDQLPTPDAVLDDDWFASLSEPEDVELHHPGSPADDSGDTADTGHTTVRVQQDDGPRIERRRLLELNEQAAAFFAARYRESWAPTYLAGRLGTDLADDARFVIGYTPAGWTALTDHLRHLGATEEEIVAAGLGSYASTGRVIDRFRDRLVFAIRDDAEIHGWIGRRNPAHDGDETGRAVPKYLNTAQTDLFTKGHELYGLAEGRLALSTGAVPVLVEGPLDAVAVTLAGEGEYVGVAPLGIAFTDTQADALRPFIGVGRPAVIVATDADPAGQQAAQRIFWQLTARGDDPRHLAVATGKDPAEMLHAAGATALRQALVASPSLARTLIDARLAVYADRLGTVEGQVLATRSAGRVIAALPLTSWRQHLTDVVSRTGIAPGIALSEVLDAARGSNKRRSIVPSWAPLPEASPGAQAKPVEGDGAMPGLTAQVGARSRSSSKSLGESVRREKDASAIRLALRPASQTGPRRGSQR